MAETRFVSIEPLGKKHNRAAFSCGVDALDGYLKRRAGQDQRRALARAFVAVDSDTGAIIGYYTLSSLAVQVGELPTEKKKFIPYPEVPSVLIGRIAVDKRFQGKGFGAALLIDALKRIVEITDTVGVHAVIVDAKEGAASFYRKFGFLPFPDRPDRLFLPIATAKKVV